MADSVLSRRLVPVILLCVVNGPVLVEFDVLLLFGRVLTSVVFVVHEDGLSVKCSVRGLVLAWFCPLCVCIRLTGDYKICVSLREAPFFHSYRESGELVGFHSSIYFHRHFYFPDKIKAISRLFMIL